jgi:ABC-type uncharacterized transport system permease subunit
LFSSYFLDADGILRVLERWFEVLCFATAFFINIRAGMINLALGGVAGLAAIGFVYLGNLGAPLGPFVVLVLGFASALLIGFLLNLLVNAVKERVGFSDLLVSLFMLYVFNWFEGYLIRLGPARDAQQQRTPQILIPPELVDFLTGSLARFLIIAFGLFLLLAFLFALKSSLFNYRTEVLALNREAILLPVNRLRIKKDVVAAIWIAASILALWVLYDVGLKSGSYAPPSKYLQPSFLGLAAGVCVLSSRSTLGLVLTSFIIAIFEELFYVLSTGHSWVHLIPSSGLNLIYGLVIFSFALFQFLRYGRNAKRMAGG